MMNPGSGEKSLTGNGEPKEGAIERDLQLSQRQTVHEARDLPLNFELRCLF
jgi:hypothetical protein